MDKQAFVVDLNVGDKDELLGEKVQHGSDAALRDHFVDIVQESDKNLAMLELGLHCLERNAERKEQKGRHEGVPLFAPLALGSCQKDPHCKQARQHSVSADSVRSTDASDGDEPWPMHHARGQRQDEGLRAGP